MRADDVDGVRRHLAGSKFKRAAAAREGLGGVPEALRVHFAQEDEPGRPAGMMRCLLTGRTVKGDAASLAHHIQGKRFQAGLLKVELEALRRAKGLPVVSDQVQRPTRRKAKRAPAENVEEGAEGSDADDADEPLLASSESEGDDDNDDDMEDAEGTGVGLDREFLDIPEGLPSTTHDAPMPPPPRPSSSTRVKAKHEAATATTAKRAASAPAPARGGKKSKAK